MLDGKELDFDKYLEYDYEENCGYANINGEWIDLGKEAFKKTSEKHKHKFYPTNNIDKKRSPKLPWSDITIRKWVCECGKIKWVKEVKE